MTCPRPYRSQVAELRSELRCSGFQYDRLPQLPVVQVLKEKLKTMAGTLERWVLTPGSECL